MKDYSQYGEGKLIFDIVAAIEQMHRFVVPKVAVEFGAGDGYHLSNIRGLMEEGWEGFQYDKEPHGLFVCLKTVTPDNIKNAVPLSCGVLSIDVDGNDYWIWKALRSNPCIVVIEFNPTLDGRQTIPHDPDHVWVGDNYFGASFQALLELGHAKGYKLVSRSACNLIFVRDDLWLGPEIIKIPKPELEGWKITDKKFQKLIGLY